MSIEFELHFNSHENKSIRLEPIFDFFKNKIGPEDDPIMHVPLDELATFQNTKENYYLILRRRTSTWTYSSKSGKLVIFIVNNKYKHIALEAKIRLG